MKGLKQDNILQKYKNKKWKLLRRSKAGFIIYSVRNFIVAKNNFTFLLP